MITAKSFATGGLGRLGNMMFTAAGVIGIAVKSGQQYGFPEFKVHDNAIFGQTVDNINEHLVKPLPGLATTSGFQDYGYFWGYRDIYLPNGNWSIDAHMQSEKFFKHCLPLIRETFTFKDEPKQNDRIAIHIRFGDYIDHPDAYHPVCSNEYYKAAIESFPAGTWFEVYSDDVEKAHDKFKELSPNIMGLCGFVGSHYSYIDHFKQMKSCKSFITSNSSFSLMAAILGDHPEKKIICPRRWFGTQAGDMDTTDVYPENAIVI